MIDFNLYLTDYYLFTLKHQTSLHPSGIYKRANI